MKIKMRVHLSGARNGRAWPPRGGILDVPDGEGVDLCAAGLAEPVAEQTPTETAVPAGGEEKAVPPQDAVEKATPQEPEERTSQGITTKNAPVTKRRTTRSKA